MDKLRALEYFLSVADAGSFSGAAKMLGVPASSVSRRIQELESDLGVALLYRTTRVVRLTELGGLYLDHVRPALSSLADADAIVTSQPHSPAGLVRITAPSGYGGVCLMPAIVKLKRQYPDLILDVELTDNVYNLASNEVDLAIRATTAPPDRSVARKLSDSKLLLVASPDYVAKHGCPRTMADVLDHKAVFYRQQGGVVYWQAKTHKAWIELRPTAAFITNRGETLLEEALAGSGLALVAQWGIGDHVTEGRLVEIEIEDAELSTIRGDNLGIYLLYHRPKYSLSKIQVTVDFLLAELAKS
ncbi:MAG: LysR family transcriptional regulator [Rhodobiaceae bacterium]|nr:LysR family transcriptional regulator [Rhodobiaceae bacterium]